MKRTDAEIRQAVLLELKSDLRIGQADLGVQVDGSIVTLSGKVGSGAERQAGQEAAHRVSGVFDVVNELQVQPAGSTLRSDVDIARAVRDTLEWDVLVPDQQIRSTVSNGRVTLQGQVSCCRQRDDVEKAVRGLAGVSAVLNQVEVVPPPVAANDLRKSIRAALERQVERDAEHIDLQVEEGRVAIRGVVHSRRELDAILGAVKGTPGVRVIENGLRLERGGL
jgi:osmotically-inducible protein OsmY